MYCSGKGRRGDSGGVRGIILIIKPENSGVEIGQGYL
jgi:hypothetical protein